MVINADSFCTYRILATVVMYGGCESRISAGLEQMRTKIG